VIEIDPSLNPDAILCAIFDPNLFLFSAPVRLNIPANVISRPFLLSVHILDAAYYRPVHHHWHAADKGAWFFKGVSAVKIMGFFIIRVQDK
jgi:hypothetical protein